MRLSVKGPMQSLDHKVSVDTPIVVLRVLACLAVPTSQKACTRDLNVLYDDDIKLACIFIGLTSGSRNWWPDRADRAS